MTGLEGDLRFGLLMALVGIGVTFGSLIFLYLILVGFAKYERRVLSKGAEQIQAGEPLPEEMVAAVGVALEKYLEQERAYVSAPSEFRLQLRKPSAWKLSGRGED